MSAFQTACLLAEVPMGTARRVVVDGRAIAVVNCADGVFAINDRCSHADVSLADGYVEGCMLECWLHGSAFDLRTGRPTSPPATMSVPTFAVRVVGEGDAAVIEVDPTPLVNSTTA